MHYTIYQITNKINGKIYIGQHKTSNLDDGYMGSGKLITYAIEKYGIENFEKKILYNFTDEEDMHSKEREIVNEDFCKRNDTYNLETGGKNGSWFYVNNTPELIEKRDKYENKLAGRKAVDKILIEKYGSKANFNRTVYQYGIDAIKEKREKCPEFREKMKEIALRASAKALSDESRTKRKETMKLNDHAKGQKNSQFGTIWITNGEENKKIKKHDLMPNGWYKGRTMKGSD